MRRARAQRACQPDERARRLPCGSARRRRRVRRDAPCARFAGHARVLLASQIVRGLARRPLARRRPRGDCRGSDHVYGPSAIHPPRTAHRGRRESAGRCEHGGRGSAARLPAAARLPCEFAHLERAYSRHDPLCVASARRRGPGDRDARRRRDRAAAHAHAVCGKSADSRAFGCRDPGHSAGESAGRAESDAPRAGILADSRPGLGGRVHAGDHDNALRGGVRMPDR